ncbi:PIG-L family deacetylase [Algoriphagus sp. CAU 1675]|uniref:PIG-L deacetylase family protein n=1 Tax=Algoriphagus sp. CAU 1675 TaxID=3032597 RepID=UPI0023DC593C|nr:PIG-L family deacetylase [Algoriphagus sp. CAU 1675]MDF2157999.1 PIG-L family deacetylase [Algoriphagus sp. CAU 1675]
MITRLLKIAGVALVLLLFFSYLLILVGRNQLHDSEIETREHLISRENKKRILAFFPHPDDEVTVSGTLMKLVDEGHEVHLLCLTKGEAGNSGEGYSKEELAKIRAEEMKQAAGIIRVEQLHLLDYPDSGLAEIGLDSIKRIAFSQIHQIQPDVLISYDSKVGLYGHPDHRLSGLALEEVFMENKGKAGFSPQSLFQVTLSPKQIQVALKLSSGFQRNYPKEAEKGLPKPDFSIITQPYFNRVLQVMKAHESQQKVLQDLMPYHDRIPSVIYSRIFDREYFHEVK